MVNVVLLLLLIAATRVWNYIHFHLVFRLFFIHGQCCVFTQKHTFSSKDVSPLMN